MLALPWRPQAVISVHRYSGACPFLSVALLSCHPVDCSPEASLGRRRAEARSSDCGGEERLDWKPPWVMEAGWSSFRCWLEGVVREALGRARPMHGPLTLEGVQCAAPPCSLFRLSSSTMP